MSWALGDDWPLNPALSGRRWWVDLIIHLGRRWRVDIPNRSRFSILWFDFEIRRANQRFWGNPNKCRHYNYSCGFFCFERAVHTCP
jgi:hypothetical protein